MRKQSGSAVGRRWFRRAAVLIVLLLGCAAIAGILGCETIIAHALVDAPNKGRRPQIQTDVSRLRELGISRELHIELAEQATLACWIIDPASHLEPLGTVLVMHGIRDSKGTQLGLGKTLSEAGYRAVLVDLPGHGDSSGDCLTYGVNESRELAILLDELQRLHLASEQVGVVAASYGAACGIQLAAIDPRIKAIVAVATFTSVRDVVPSYLKLARVHWLVSDAALERAFERAETIARFDIDQASPLQAIQQTSAHVLFIHGEADMHIPIQHSERLHQACLERSKLIRIPGEDHDTIMGDRKGIIKREMLAWLEMHLQ